MPATARPDPIARLDPAPPAPPRDGPAQHRAADAFCPHCYLLVEAAVGSPWPLAPARCPHCRLMIGAGRARQASDGVPGARGAAAGVIAGRARHAESHAERSHDEIRAGIRAVASRAGVAPERLLMVDYQQHLGGGEDLPELNEVLAAFGSWKRARREAAGRPVRADG